jgi:hypothetical protein
VGTTNRTDRTGITAGHAFIQNLRRGHYELGLDEPPALRISAAFTELARAVGPEPDVGFNASTDPTTNSARPKTGHAPQTTNSAGLVYDSETS